MDNKNQEESIISPFVGYICAIDLINESLNYGTSKISYTTMDTAKRIIDSQLREPVIEKLQSILVSEHDENQKPIMCLTFGWKIEHKLRSNQIDSNFLMSLIKISTYNFMKFEILLPSRVTSLETFSSGFTFRCYVWNNNYNPTSIKPQDVYFVNDKQGSVDLSKFTLKEDYTPEENTNPKMNLSNMRLQQLLSNMKVYNIGVNVGDKFDSTMTHIKNSLNNSTNNLSVTSSPVMTTPTTITTTTLSKTTTTTIMLDVISEEKQVLNILREILDEFKLTYEVSIPAKSYDTTQWIIMFNRLAIFTSEIFMRFFTHSLITKSHFLVKMVFTSNLMNPSGHGICINFYVQDTSFEMTRCKEYIKISIDYPYPPQLDNNEIVKMKQHQQSMDVAVKEKPKSSFMVWMRNHIPFISSSTVEDTKKEDDEEKSQRKRTRDESEQLDMSPPKKQKLNTENDA